MLAAVPAILLLSLHSTLLLSSRASQKSHSFSVSRQQRHLVASFLLSARLLPFRKKDNGVRPIAIGEVLRRLVAKVGFQLVLPKVKEDFPPNQVGVALKEAVPHVSFAVRCAQMGCQTDQIWGIVQIDVTNAFPTIKREEILSNVWPDFPILGKWAEFWLCNPGPLLTEDDTVLSTRGVQQGDPLGPFLFSVGIQRVIRQLQVKHQGYLQIWYLDDGVFFGKALGSGHSFS